MPNNIGLIYHEHTTYVFVCVLDAVPVNSSYWYTQIVVHHSWDARRSNIRLNREYSIMLACICFVRVQLSLTCPVDVCIANRVFFSRSCLCACCQKQHELQRKVRSCCFWKRHQCWKMTRAGRAHCYRCCCRSACVCMIQSGIWLSIDRTHCVCSVKREFYEKSSDIFKHLNQLFFSLSRSVLEGWTKVNGEW